LSPGTRDANGRSAASPRQSADVTATVPAISRKTPVDTQSTATAFGNEVVQGASDFVQSSESIVVGTIGVVTSFVGQFIGVVSDMVSLANAYNQHAP
jgi:hypothetical protein